MHNTRALNQKRTFPSDDYTDLENTHFFSPPDEQLLDLYAFRSQWPSHNFSDYIPTKKTKISRIKTFFNDDTLNYLEESGQSRYFHYVETQTSKRKEDELLFLENEGSLPDTPSTTITNIGNQNCSNEANKGPLEPQSQTFELKLIEYKPFEENSEILWDRFKDVPLKEPKYHCNLLISAYQSELTTPDILSDEHLNSRTAITNSKPRYTQNRVLNVVRAMKNAFINGKLQAYLQILTNSIGVSIKDIGRYVHETIFSGRGSISKIGNAICRKEQAGMIITPETPREVVFKVAAYHIVDEFFTGGCYEKWLDEEYKVGSKAEKGHKKNSWQSEEEQEKNAMAKRAYLMEKDKIEAAFKNAPKKVQRGGRRE